jgi:hypothetical protein
VPAVVKALRFLAGVALRIIGGVVGFAVLITAGAYFVHGVILLIRAIP